MRKVRRISIQLNRKSSTLNIKRKYVDKPDCKRLSTLPLAKSLNNNPHPSIIQSESKIHSSGHAPDKAKQTHVQLISLSEI